MFSQLNNAYSPPNLDESTYLPIQSTVCTIHTVHPAQPRSIHHASNFTDKAKQSQKKKQYPPPQSIPTEGIRLTRGEINTECCLKRALSSKIVCHLSSIIQTGHFRQWESFSPAPGEWPQERPKNKPVVCSAFSSNLSLILSFSLSFSYSLTLYVQYTAYSRTCVVSIHFVCPFASSVHFVP